MVNHTSIRIDARLVDDQVYKVIEARADSTWLARITIEQISLAVDCHWNTAWKSTERLVNAGRLQKLTGRGRQGMVFKVVVHAHA